MEFGLHSSEHQFMCNTGLSGGSDGGFCGPILILYNMHGSNAPRASRKLSERLLSCSQMMSASASSVRPRASYQPWPATTAQTALSAFPTSMTSASAPVAGSTCGEQGGLPGGSGLREMQSWARDAPPCPLPSGIGIPWMSSLPCYIS